MDTNKRMSAVQLDTWRAMQSISSGILQQAQLCIVNVIRVNYAKQQARYLCNNVAWLNHYLAQDYPRIGYFEQHDLAQTHMLWTGLSDADPVVIDSRQMFNINYGITLKRRWSQGCDYFNFGSAMFDASVQQTLLNQRELLQQFMQEFYAQHAQLFEHASTYSLVEHQNSRRIYLGDKYQQQYLTQREMATLRALLRGLTVPELAQQLTMSKRTAEKHVENIKHKLQCKTQCQLGFVAAELGLIEVEG